jgi:hypothetical protein
MRPARHHGRRGGRVGVAPKSGSCRGKMHHRYKFGVRRPMSSRKSWFSVYCLSTFLKWKPAKQGAPRSPTRAVRGEESKESSSSVFTLLELSRAILSGKISFIRESVTRMSSVGLLSDSVMPCYNLTLLTHCADTANSYPPCMVYEVYLYLTQPLFDHHLTLPSSDPTNLPSSDLTFIWPAFIWPDLHLTRPDLHLTRPDYHLT